VDYTLTAPSQAATITPLSTTVAIVSSENPSLPLDDVTFTVNVQTNGATTGLGDDGTVQFVTNGVAYGLPVGVTGGVVSTNLAILPHGSNLVTAVYSGDGNLTISSNSVWQVVNTPPVAGSSFTMGALIGIPVTVQIVGGNNTPTDADGDALTITSVTGAVNGTVTTDGTNVTYTATGGTTDSFTYTVSDPYGATASQTVNVTISQAGPNFNSLAAPVLNGDGTMTIGFLGIPGYNYELDWTADVTPPAIWTPVMTNTAAASGAVNFNVTPSGSDGYYRTRQLAVP